MNKKMMAAIMSLVIALMPTAQLCASESGKASVSEKKQGFDTEYFDNDISVEGYWINDKLEGPAVTYADGGTKTGNYNNGELLGPRVDIQGDFITIYNRCQSDDGLWITIDSGGDVVNTRDDLLTWKDKGITYYAESKKSLADGEAIAILDNGSIYVGEFKNNKRDGRAVYYNKSGDWWDGSFAAGKWEGYFTYYFPYSESTKKHDVYCRGYYKDGKAVGVHEYYYSDNSRTWCKLTGERFDGIAVTVSEKGKVTFSEYDMGKLVKNNISTWTGNNGCTYVGEKKGNSVKGYGAVIYKNGAIGVGNFNNGALEGETYFVFPENDIYYDGYSKKGNYDGEGGMYYRNGNYYKGTYSNGELTEGTHYEYYKGWYEGTFKSGKYYTGSYTKILGDKSTEVIKYKNGKLYNK